MSLIMHGPLSYNGDSGNLYQNLQSCNCCPYGYHIDLDFVRYCESLVNYKPSDGELLRRDKRRSRTSLEVMLGFDGFYQSKVQPVQEAHIEIEPDSPRVVNGVQNYLYNCRDESTSTTNSSPETSAFLHDALDEVVSDFERTLERTKKKDKRSSSWGHYVYAADSCVSGNKSPARNDATTSAQEQEEIDSLCSRKSDTGAQALCIIREQMAISLNRMKDLEDQVKTIPELQKQLATLEEEKRQLQQRLQKEEAFSRSCTQYKSTVFTPKRVSPVSLESLGSRIRSKSSLEFPKKILKRDIGVMCGQNPSTRDVGTLASPAMVRSVGVNSTNTNGIHDDIYTKQDLESFAESSIRSYEERLELWKQQNSISVGTQMVPKSQVNLKHTFVQTSSPKEVEKKSQGVTVFPSQKDAEIICKPECRTVGSSDNRITDIFCDKCLTPKRTVACGPDTEETKNYLSLKQMDMPPRSLSFALGDNEKVNIKRKTVGTQCQRINVHNKSVQSSIQTDSVGVQHVVISLSKSCQYSVDSCSSSTDTTDLTNFADCSMNTDEVVETKIITRDNFSNTDLKRTKDNSCNTISPARMKHSGCNTDRISKKDVGCGDTIKPHISIACADNYCDSCKDAIRNLAKDFCKTSPTASSNERTRIPRPTTLTSPRPIRKTLIRQNTYTLPSPTFPSPTLPEKLSVEQICTSVTSENILSTSLDSVKLSEGLTSGWENELLSKCGTSELEATTTEDYQNKHFQVDLREKELPKPVVNGDNGLKGEESVSLDSSQEGKRNSMLLNQIATSISEPRTKITPTKEMRAAMKVINDSLNKTNSNQSNLKNANNIVQKEWFRISSVDKAIPLDVEDYLDCFEEYSTSLLKYIVNMVDTNGNTAMHYSVSHGNFDVVSILLDSKVCNVNQTNNAGYTCVMLVSLAKLKNSAHRTVVQRLFQMADVNIRAKKHCQTALMLAVSHGNLDMVKMLLSAGADINIQDEDGSTALMCAAEHGFIDIVKHLLSQTDCDSLITDVDGSTAFKIAWQAGHRDIGMFLYVHEQMLRSKMPSKVDQRSPGPPRRPKTHQQQSQ